MNASRRGPELQTERLLLRRWVEADRAPFAAMNADPLVMEHFEATLEAATSDAWLARMDARFELTGYGLWAVERRSDSRWLGMTGLAAPTFEAAFTPRVEVGWRFAAELWGHGYATEAAQAAIEYGFSSSGCARSCRSRRSATGGRAPSWSASAWCTIRLTTSSIRGCPRAIPSDHTSCTAAPHPASERRRGDRMGLVWR